MLFFEHQGYYMYVNDDHIEIPFLNNNLKKSRAIPETICMIANLGIDGEKFLDNFIEALSDGEKVMDKAVKVDVMSLFEGSKNKDKINDFLSNRQFTECGELFNGSMEDKVSTSITLAAYATFGQFLGTFMSEYIINYLNASNAIPEPFSSCKTAEEGVMYLVNIGNIITNAINEIILLVNYLFPNDTPPVESYKIFENQRIKFKFLLFENGLISVYEIDDADISSLILFLFYELLKFYKLGKQLCECKNCKRLFLPSLRKEEVYCNHINPNGKTCKEIGYENTMDTIDKAYRKAYKTKNAYKNRAANHRPNIGKQFDEWVLRAQGMKRLVKNKDISEADYHLFLDKRLDEVYGGT